MRLRTDPRARQWSTQPVLLWLHPFPCGNTIAPCLHSSRLIFEQLQVAKWASILLVALLPNRLCAQLQDMLTKQPPCPGPCAWYFFTSNLPQSPQETMGPCMSLGEKQEWCRMATSQSHLGTRQGCNPRLLPSQGPTHCSLSASELIGQMRATLTRFRQTFPNIPKMG